MLFVLKADIRRTSSKTKHDIKFALFRSANAHLFSRLSNVVNFEKFFAQFAFLRMSKSGTVGKNDVVYNEQI